MLALILAEIFRLRYADDDAHILIAALRRRTDPISAQAQAPAAAAPWRDAHLDFAFQRGHAFLCPKYRFPRPKNDLANDIAAFHLEYTMFGIMDRQQEIAGRASRVAIGSCFRLFSSYVATSTIVQFRSEKTQVL